MKKASGMSDRTSNIILTVVCAIVLFIVAYPLYYVVVASFSDPYEVYAGKTFLFPSGFTLDGYKGVFLNEGIVSGFLNSVKYTVIGTIFSVVMLYITAYPLAQKGLPGRKALSIFFLFTMYFAGGLVPTYLVVKQTGLVGSMWSLFLPGGVGVGNMIIVRNYFQNSIPRDLIEASEIDGCSKLRTFFSVVIPCPCPSWPLWWCSPWWPTGTTGSPPSSTWAARAPPSPWSCGTSSSRAPPPPARRQPSPAATPS